MTTTTATTVVVPTIGRTSLRATLHALTTGHGPPVEAVIVVDDRPGGTPSAPGDPASLGIEDLDVPELRVIRSGGGGPAKARNLGWRLARTPWVSFLDDDVVPEPDWREALATDLAPLGNDIAGSQGRVRVPLPTDSRPTDWERSTAGLEAGRWITADMSYRRSALAAVGGFDERFPRAFREDSDLALRVSASQGRLVRGHRWIAHPVRPADDWVSLRQQAGNADDILMRRLHGPDWRARAGVPRGRRSQHVTTTTAAVAATGLALAGRRLPALAAAGMWAGCLAEFASSRIRPGPRDVAEVRRMLGTSTLIPFAATWHAARGTWRHRAAGPWRGLPDLVLFDRDGTLVDDVPYNGDPALVRPRDGAADALDRLRAAGIRVGVITNQSGIAAGTVTAAQAQAVNDRVEALLGPFDTWQVCPHDRDEGCTCRKPAPGMVKDACEALGVEPARCVVIGDIGSDVEAATAAGAAGILVPTPATAFGDVQAAGQVSPDLPRAVDDVLGGRW